MRRLIWSPLARDQLFRITDSYAERDSALAIEMLERIKAVPTLLLDHPR